MPWQLTTPLGAGDMHAGVTQYPQVKIVREQSDTNKGEIVLQWQWGDTVAGKWVPGVEPVGVETYHRIRGQEYIDLVTAHVTGAGELTYQAVKRALYEHLAAQGKIGPGVLV